MDKEKIVRDMLIAIGEDPDRPGLKDTPARVVRMWKEILRGYDELQKPKITTFMNGEDGVKQTEMITDSGDFYSHCEHHMVPFFGKYWFAYIPHPQGKVLGLSKVARVVDFYSAKLQIQERLVYNIIGEIEKALTIKGPGTVEYKPLGLALVMEGEHLCKSMRGVKKKGLMRTTELRGAFKDDGNTRTEFMAWVNK